jgi:hypothetical protein
MFFQGLLVKPSSATNVQDVLMFYLFVAEDGFTNKP